MNPAHGLKLFPGCCSCPGSLASKGWKLLRRLEHLYFAYHPCILKMMSKESEYDMNMCACILYTYIIRIYIYIFILCIYIHYVYYMYIIQNMQMILHCRCVVHEICIWSHTSICMHACTICGFNILYTGMLSSFQMLKHAPITSKMLHLLCQFFPSAAIPLSVHHACKRACTHSGIGTWWQATCPTTWSVSGAEFTPKTGASRWSPSGALNVLRKTQTRAVSHHFDSLRIFDPPLLHHASSTWCRCRSSRKGWMDSRSFWHLLPDAHGMMHTSTPCQLRTKQQTYFLVFFYQNPGATVILPYVLISNRLNHLHWGSEDP